MNKVFEKIIEKLEEEKSNVPVNRLLDDIIKDKPKELGQLMAYNKAIEIVKQEADQYNNGWIPCIDLLPEESGEYLTCVEYHGDRFISIDEIDCDGIIKEWNCSTDYKIIAWKPLPQPYQPKGE